MLRSRRLAVWLIGGLVGYAALVTLGPELVDHPFSNPVFLSAGALLCAATIACAGERTGAARKYLRALRSTRAIEDRLRSHPQSAVSVAPGVEDPMAKAVESLRGLGLSGTAENGVYLATSRSWGAFGSPVFHWALAALLAILIAGQLMRAEGGINAVVGSVVTDAPSSYLPGANRGPMLANGTGLQLLAEETTRSVVVGGVDRGQGALITLSRSGQVIARQWVYPNHVLRSGSTMVFVSGTGPAAYFELTAAGATVRVPVAFDTPSGTEGLLGPEALRVTTPSGQELDVSVEPLAGQRVRVSVQGRPPATLALGDSTPVSEGGVLKLTELTSFALLTVVRDPSVLPVYVAFLVALIGLAVALFAPPRACAVVLVSGPDGERSLHVQVRATRVDMALQGRVVRALTGAVKQDPEGA